LNLIKSLSFRILLSELDINSLPKLMRYYCTSSSWIRLLVRVEFKFAAQLALNVIKILICSNLAFQTLMPTIV